MGPVGGPYLQLFHGPRSGGSFLPMFLVKSRRAKKRIQVEKNVQVVLYFRAGANIELFMMSYHMGWGNKRINFRNRYASYFQFNRRYNFLCRKEELLFRCVTIVMSFVPS